MNYKYDDNSITWKDRSGEECVLYQSKDGLEFGGLMGGVCKLDATDTAQLVRTLQRWLKVGNLSPREGAPQTSHITILSTYGSEHYIVYVLCGESGCGYPVTKIMSSEEVALFSDEYNALITRR